MTEKTFTPPPNTPTPTKKVTVELTFLKICNEAQHSLAESLVVHTTRKHKNFIYSRKKK